SNYQFLIDNLLDLTHVIYVHKKTLAGDPREATTPTKTERLPDGVRVGRWLIDFVPPPLYAKAGNFTGNVDRWQLATWPPPLPASRRRRAVGDLHAALAGVARRRRRQDRTRRPRRRPQPGHIDLVEPPGHARDRDYESLPVLLCA